MKNKVLIAVTTYNQLDITKRCLDYIDYYPGDILVVDDCSTDGTIDWLDEQPFTVYQKDERRGLTDSWNIAYHWFRDNKYSAMIIMNNDVFMPHGAIENMISDYPLVVPMTNWNGAGYACKAQAIDFHKSVGELEPGTERHLQNIQDLCSKGFKDINSWTGFCMCFSRQIVDYERSDGNLFDPENINVGNDDDLAKRVKAKLATGSFVLHLKGQSFKGKIANRNDISTTNK